MSLTEAQVERYRKIVRNGTVKFVADGQPYADAKKMARLLAAGSSRPKGEFWTVREILSDIDEYERAL